eukprot:scaffold35361_cov129-Isochrysis_galbana.AAC.1
MAELHATWYMARLEKKSATLRGSFTMAHAWRPARRRLDTCRRTADGGGPDLGHRCQKEAHGRMMIIG